MCTSFFNRALLLSLFCGLLVCTAGSVHAAVDGSIYTSGWYFLTMGNLPCGNVEYVAGGGAHADIINVDNGNGTSTKHISPPIYDPFTIQVSPGMSDPFNNWLNNAWTAAPYTKSGSIITTSYVNHARSERQFTDALITGITIPECDYSNKSRSYLGVTFVPTISKDVPPDTSKQFPAVSKAWLSANFALEIDRIDCANVVKINSFTVKRELAPKNAGSVRDPQINRGKLTFPNLFVTIAESSTLAWSQWFDSYVIAGNNSTTVARQGRIIFYSDRQVEMGRIELRNIGICSYTLIPATADSPTRRQAELFCDSMSLIFPGQSGGSSAPTGVVGNPPVPNGKLGTVYNMRETNPLQLNVKKLDYTTAQVNIGENCYVPTADEKLMLAHFSIKNPTTANIPLRGDSLKFVAADAAGNNFEATSDWANTIDSKIIDTQLLQNQQLECIAVIKLNAKDRAVKLQVISPDNSPILEFPLLGDFSAVNPVTPLPAPIADPADKTGSTALTLVPGQLNATYPYKQYEVTVEKSEYATNAFNHAPLRAGKQFMIFTLLVKNKSTIEANLRFDTFKAILSSANGQEFTYGGDLYSETGNRRVDTTVKPGNEARVHLFFRVPKESTPMKLTLREDDSRTYSFSTAELRRVGGL